MDTNHDGVLTIQDDPYSPFYPGGPCCCCQLTRLAQMLLSVFQQAFSLLAPASPAAAMQRSMAAMAWHAARAPTPAQLRYHVLDCSHTATGCSSRHLPRPGTSPVQNPEPGLMEAGDQYVAWVGMSSYSWGGTGSAPYLNNILAGPDQFANAVSESA